MALHFSDKNKKVLSRYYTKQTGLFTIPFKEMDDSVLNALVLFLLRVEDACICGVADTTGEYPEFKALSDANSAYIVTPKATVVRRNGMEGVYDSLLRDLFKPKQMLREPVGNSFSLSEEDYSKVAVEMDHALYDSGLSGDDIILGLFLENSSDGISYELKEIRSPIILGGDYQ